MRLRDIAICRLRRWLRMCGSPSVDFASSLISCFVIIVCCRLRRIDDQHVDRAEQRCPATIADCRIATIDAGGASTRSTTPACAPEATSSGMAPWIANHRAMPTTPVFSSDFAPSHSACLPTSRPAPLTRSNWSKWGLNRFM